MEICILWRRMNCPTTSAELSTVGPTTCFCVRKAKSNQFMALGMRALRCVAVHDVGLCLALRKVSSALRTQASQIVARLVAESVRCSAHFFVADEGNANAAAEQEAAATQMARVCEAAGTALACDGPPLPPQVRKQVRQLSAGAQHVVFCCADGAAYAMGNSGDGRLGFRGRGKLVSTPRAIDLPAVSIAVAKVAAGGRHTLLLAVTGCCFSFGCGRGGRLGHGMPASCVFEPRALRLAILVVDIAAGTSHSLFATADGSALSCGVGGDGRLGLGNAVRRAFRPTRVLGLTGFRVTAVAVSAPVLTAARDCGAHSLFLTDGGRVFGCGSCGNARLGVRQRVFARLGFSVFSRSCHSHASCWRSVDTAVPVQLLPDGSDRIVSFAAGHNTTALLTSDGRICTFGASRRLGCRPRQPWARGVPPAEVLLTALEEDRVRCRGAREELAQMLLPPIDPEQPQWEPLPLQQHAAVQSVAFVAGASLIAWAGTECIELGVQMAPPPSAPCVSL